VTPSDHVRMMLATFDAKDVSALARFMYRSYIDATRLYS
jgi:hypothetical protein